MSGGATVDVYWLPHCTTCQKAVDYLHAQHVKVRGMRDLKAQPLTRPEVEDLARKVGGPEKLFSKRAMKFRKMGLHEQTLSDDDLLRLMSEEYTFITRPVIVAGERATAGFSQKRIDELVQG